MAGRSQRSHALVRRFVSGDSSAFERLVEDWDPAVFAFAYRLLGDVHEAADARQTTWLKVFQKLTGFEARSRFETWLYRVAWNVCRDRRRERREDSLTGEVLTSTYEPLQVVARREESSRVLAALAELDEELQVCVVLRHYHSLAVSRVAEILDVPRTTVHSRLSRGLRALARHLQSPCSSARVRVR